MYTARDQQAPGEGPQARAQDHHIQGAQDRLRQPRRPALRLGEYYHYYTALTMYYTHSYMHAYNICIYTILLWCGWLTGVCRGQPARGQEPAVPGPGHGELQGRLV